MRALGSVLVSTLLPLFAACGGGGAKSRPAPAPLAAPPLIVEQAFNATEDTDFSGTIVAQPPAGASATIAVTAAPTRGTLAAFAPTGAFTYRPNANLSGADVFTVEATDTRGNRRSATITISVAAVNDAPLAVPEFYELAVGAAPVLAVLDNDTDVEDTALAIVIPAATGPESNPSVGTATVSGNNRIALALPVGFRGVTRVTYRVRDAANAESAPATAVVFVGTPQFDVWYQGTTGTHPSQILVTDLANTRQVTQFVLPRKADGLTLSADHDVALIAENDGAQLRDLWTVGTRQVEAPVRVTPGHDTTQTIEGFAMNDDGTWVAYVVSSAVSRQLWLVERANPAGRRQIPLPVGYHLGVARDLEFSGTGAALYFTVQSDSAGFTHLLRVAVTGTATPRFIYPLQGEAGYARAWFAAPDDSYVIARSSDLYRVSVADPTQRVQINAPIPPGDQIGLEITDPAVTRVVYVTTGGSPLTGDHDRLWFCDVGAPGTSTLLVDADPARTGGFTPLSLRPDRNGFLATTLARSGTKFQYDLVEVTVSPADGVLHPVSPAPAAGTYTGSDGDYLDDDTVIYGVSSVGITQLYEARRGSFGAPTPLIEEGVVSAEQVFSRDHAVVGFTHSRYVFNDSNFWGVLVNRAAPGAMMRITMPSPVASGAFLAGLVERR